MFYAVQLKEQGWWLLSFYSRFELSSYPRFDLDGTKHFFLLAFTVPAAFWITSCSFLATSSKVATTTLTL